MDKNNTDQFAFNIGSILTSQPEANLFEYTFNLVYFKWEKVENMHEENQY